MIEFVRRLFGADMNEYFERFMLPRIEELREIGVSDDDIEAMVRDAIAQSDDYFPPGLILRNMLDEQREIQK